MNKNVKESSLIFLSRGIHSYSYLNISVTALT